MPRGTQRLPAGRPFVYGEEADVYRKGKQVFRASGFNEQTHPLLRYYYHKIANVFSPGIALRLTSANSKGISTSSMTHVDRDYKHYRDKYYSTRSHQCRICARHEKRVERIAEPEKGRLLELGVWLNDRPPNVAFRNGKPFFFEVNRIDPWLVRQAAAKLPKKKRDKVEEYLKRIEYRTHML